MTTESPQPQHPQPPSTAQQSKPSQPAVSAKDAAAIAKAAAKGGWVGVGIAAMRVVGKNPKLRRRLIILSLLPMLPMLVLFASVTILPQIAIMALMKDTDDGSSVAMSAAGVNSAQISAARDQAGFSGVPTEITAWFLKNKPDLASLLPAAGTKVRETLPTAADRSLRAGTVLPGSDSKQQVGYIEDPSEEGKALRERTRAGWVAALQVEVTLPDGTTGPLLSEADAKTAVDEAMLWALGNTPPGTCPDLSTGGSSDSGSSAGERVAIDAEKAGQFARLDAEQEKNVKLILGATNVYLSKLSAEDRTYAQVVAIANAMGESTLMNVDYGDDAGPDSRGLFQQRDSWGPLAKRMDPQWATTMFLSKLMQVQDWKTRPLGQVSWDVQHFKKELIDKRQGFLEPAKAVVAAYASRADVLQPTADFGVFDPATNTDTSTGGASSGGGSVPVAQVSGDGCSTTVVGFAGGPVVMPVGPNIGPGDPDFINDAYGDRVPPPVAGALPFHNGTDYFAMCYAPVFAVVSAEVTGVGTNIWKGLGNLVEYRDDVNGFTFWSGHLALGGIVVKVGDHVQPGQLIGYAGTTGASSGCHLHFEIHKNGRDRNTSFDPDAWLVSNHAAKIPQEAIDAAKNTPGCQNCNAYD